MIKLNLHVLLAQYRITQRELAEITGIRQGTISAYCSNTFKHIVISHMDKICYVLNCEPHDLISYEKTIPEGIDEEKRKSVFETAYKNTPKYMVRADNNEVQMVSEPIGEYILDTSFQKTQSKIISDEIMNQIIDNVIKNIPSQIETVLDKKFKGQQLENIIKTDNEARKRFFDNKDNKSDKENEDK